MLNRRPVWIGYVSVDGKDIDKGYYHPAPAGEPTVCPGEDMRDCGPPADRAASAPAPEGLATMLRQFRLPVDVAGSRMPWATDWPLDRLMCAAADELDRARPAAAPAPEGLEAMARRIADKTYTGGNLAFRETLYQDILDALRDAAAPEGLDALRARIVELLDGTRVNGVSRAEAFEVETIHKTLNVVLAEIDAAALRARPVPSDVREMARDAVDRVFKAIDWRRCDFDDDKAEAVLIAFARAVLARHLPIRYTLPEYDLSGIEVAEK